MAALALAVFYAHGLQQWLPSGHDFRDAWQAATQDWLLAITLFDLGLFGLLCFVWSYRDMQKQGYSALKKCVVLLAMLIAGVVALLFYLAFRKTPGAQKAME